MTSCESDVGWMFGAVLLLSKREMGGLCRVQNKIFQGLQFFKILLNKNKIKRLKVNPLFLKNPHNIS
jgi:hypothetical protein